MTWRFLKEGLLSMLEGLLSVLEELLSVLVLPIVIGIPLGLLIGLLISAHPPEMKKANLSEFANGADLADYLAMRNLRWAQCCERLAEKEKK